MNFESAACERVTTIPDTAAVTVQVATPARQALPPKPDVLRRLEHPKVMNWMAAIPIALGALGTTDGNYITAVLPTQLDQPASRALSTSI